MNLSRETLRWDIAAGLPDNTVGAIDPAAVLRAVLYSVADSRPNVLDEPLAALAHTHGLEDIAGLAAALAPWETRSNRGQASGYAGLEVSGRLPLTELTRHAATHAWNGSDPVHPGFLFAASLSHAGRHAAAGPDALTAAAIGAVALSHGGRHILGGPDPVTPAMIQAANLSHGHQHAAGGGDAVGIGDIQAADASHSHASHEPWLADWRDDYRRRSMTVSLVMPQPQTGLYDLHLWARHPASIRSLRHATLSGSVQATVLVDEMAVAGLSGLVAGPSPILSTAPGGLPFAQGARIRLRLEAVQPAAADYAVLLGIS